MAAWRRSPFKASLWPDDMPVPPRAVNLILTRNVEIPPTGGSAGAPELGRLGGGLHLARPGERMGADPLRVPRHADRPYGRGALGGARPSGRLGAGRRAARRGGGRRRRPAVAASPSVGPRPPAEHLPGCRDLAAVAGDPAPCDAPAHARPADRGGEAPPGRAARRAHRAAAD